MTQLPTNDYGEPLVEFESPLDIFASLDRKGSLGLHEGEECIALGTSEEPYDVREDLQAIVEVAETVETVKHTYLGKDHIGTILEYQDIEVGTNRIESHKQEAGEEVWRLMNGYSDEDDSGDDGFRLPDTETQDPSEVEYDTELLVDDLIECLEEVTRDIIVGDDPYELPVPHTQCTGFSLRRPLFPEAETEDPILEPLHDRFQRLFEKMGYLQYATDIFDEDVVYIRNSSPTVYYSDWMIDALE